MSTSSRACPRPSPSTRSRPRATRVRPWGRSPRSTTTSVCSMPASGTPTARSVRRPVARQTPQQIVDRVLELPEGTRFQVMAPVVRGRKGEYSTLLDDLAKQGFARVRVDGVPLELADRAEANLARYETHTIEVVVDRLIRRGNVRQRLTESIEAALELTGGTAEILVMNGGADAEPDEAITFSQHLACSHCGISFEEPAPAQLLLQLPLRARARPVPGSALVTKSIPTSSCLTTRSRWPRVPCPHGREPAANTSPASRPVWPSTPASPSTPLGRSSRPRTRSSSSTARAPSPSTSRTRTASTGSVPTRPTTRASCPGSSAAMARPSPTGRASRSRGTCARWPARCAAGPASSPNRSP